MGTAGRSCVKTKKFAFSQQIEKFAWQLRRDAYTSPKYYCELTDCNWSLFIEPVRESFFTPLDLPPFCDYIEISLRRNDYKTENQSVDVHLTVVDSFNLGSFYASKELRFTPSFNKGTVMRIKKKDLCHGYFGLNKMRFTPNEILTVKCEITVYETVEENFTTEDELEDTTKYKKNDTLFIFGFLTAVVSVFYIKFHFEIPIFIPLCVIYVLWGLLKISWNFMKPGGDRTYDKPQDLTETRLGFLIAVVSVFYIKFHFEIPIFVSLCITFALWGLLKISWNFIKLDGDSTYNKPQDATENRPETNRNNNNKDL